MLRSQISLNQFIIMPQIADVVSQKEHPYLRETTRFEKAFLKILLSYTNYFSFPFLLKTLKVKLCGFLKFLALNLKDKNISKKKKK